MQHSLSTGQATQDTTRIPAAAQLFSVFLNSGARQTFLQHTTIQTKQQHNETYSPSLSQPYWLHTGSTMKTWTAHM